MCYHCLDKMEALRLRRIVIEGLSEEQVFSSTFQDIVTPCVAMSVLNSVDGDNRY